MLNKNESDVLANISAEEAWGHVEYLSTLDKTSGTDGERKAHEYVRGKLKEYGVPYKEYEFDSYLSHPIKASLEVVSPSKMEVKAITAAFSKSTDGERIEAEMVHVPLPEGTLFGGFSGLVDLYRKLGVEGKVILVWGLASPTVMWAAQLAGAIGQVHISGEDVIHEMIVTTIWGTPTSESAERMPTIPAISIGKSDGERLLELIEEGEVRVSFSTVVDTRWRRIPITVAEIQGTEDPEKFMLIHGHMDSWYVGTTDNCTGNAACLELSRLFWENREKLRRGVRIAWWSGHSTGRYSGSTWYADNLFEELNKGCFVSMNIDSPGVQGATLFRGGGLMGTAEFMGEAVKDATGAKEVPVSARSMRAGDQSFYGIGIPNVGVGSGIPMGSPLRGVIIGGSGGGWWWHSAHDTVDKGDSEVLHRDLKMQALATYRFCNVPLLPFDFVPVAEVYEREVKDIQGVVPAETFNLAKVLDKIAELKASSERLNAVIGESKSFSGDVAKAVNGKLIGVTRVLTSTLYTYEGSYEQDPAWNMGIIPSLQGVRELEGLDPESTEARFLKTKLVREVNKVNDQLDKAIELIVGIVKLSGK